MSNTRVCLPPFHVPCFAFYMQSGNHGRVCAAGAMIPLVQLAAGEARRYILLRDDGTIDVEGMSDPLREPRLDEEMIRLLGYDVDCRRFVPRVLTFPEGVTFVFLAYGTLLT